MWKARRADKNTDRRWSGAKPLQIRREYVEPPTGVTEILSYLRHLYICGLYAGVPFHFTPACVLLHFQRTDGQIIEHQHLQCEISGLKILLLNAVELQIRQNKGTSNITHGDCAKHTTSSFLIPTSYVKNTSSFKTSSSPLATTSSILIHNSYFKTIIMKIFKDMKTWKTIIQFIITVLTAIISSFFVQSCKTGF